MSSFIRRYRFTLLASLVAIIAWQSPTVTEWLQLDYSRVGEGEWWRIWTGHLTHFDGNHLFFDLLMFVVLGSACEREHPSRFAASVGVMMLGVAAVVGLSQHDIGVYRGLSGVDTGLFVWFVTDQYRHARIKRDQIARVGWSIALLALAGKLVFELASGQTLFVDSSSFKPLVESHLAGGAVGVAAFLFCTPAISPDSSDDDGPTDNTSLRVDVLGAGQRL